MKRYQFELAPVLRARRLQEGLARSELQKANLAAAAAERAEHQSLAHYDQLTGSEDAEWPWQRERSVLAAQAVVQARRSLAATTAAVGAALDGYLAAAKAVSVLEHLDERRREEHALAASHEQATLVDELVTSRHARRLLRRGKEGLGA
ncbi:MAG: hypothetical protein ACRDZX_09960 [Acidimicrobiales bacterium]